MKFALSGFSTGSALKTALGSLRLNVVGRQFVVRDSIVGSGGAQVLWRRTPHPGWTDGQTVAVSLTDVVPAGVPTKPYSVRARAGQGHVALSWHIRDRRVTKIQYQQKAGTNAWGAWTDIPHSRRSGGPNKKSWTVAGLSNGTAYRFRLRGVNPAGPGLVSDVVGPVTPAAAPLPAHLDGVRAIARTHGGTVQLAWNHPDDGSITKYQFSGRKVSDTATAVWTDIPHSNSHTTYHVVTALEDGEEYAFRVRAVNASGNGPASAEVRATPGTKTVYGYQLARISAEPHDDRLDVRWRVIGGGPVWAGYQIEIRKTGTSDPWRSWEFQTLSDYPSTSIWGLTPGTSYDVRILVRGQPPQVAWERTWSTTGTAPPAAGSGSMQLGSQPEATEGPASAEPQEQSPPEAVAPPAAEPLTARVSKAPAAHDGSAFAVRVAFSAPVAGRAKDASIQVSGGTLTRAVRVKQRKDLWELRVTPSGLGAVTVTLPATADCSAAGPCARRTGGGWRPPLPTPCRDRWRSAWRTRARARAPGPPWTSR